MWILWHYAPCSCYLSLDHLYKDINQLPATIRFFHALLLLGEGKEFGYGSGGGMKGLGKSKFSLFLLSFFFAQHFTRR